jgi:D-glycero-alpha-D-manno-heptose 1-phosphate guanylyltransferase
MAEVAGKPFLSYIISSLENVGFHHIILSLGFMHEVVEEWVASLECRARITCVVENVPLGTGGGVRLALQKAAEEDVFILNGDTFFGVSYRNMLQQHLQSGAIATIALKKMRDFDRYGAVEIESQNGFNRITDFKEKSHCEEGLINGGLYIIKKNVLDDFPEKFSLEKDFFEKRDDIYGYISDGYFIDIGIPEDYKRADHDFAQGIYKPMDTLFLDRDGVINVLRPYDYVKSVEEFKFEKGAIEALAILSPLFARILIISNQRGVGKGIMSNRDLEIIHKYMLEKITAGGGRIDKIYICTDTDDSSPDRKPNIGMALQALRDYPDIDLTRSLMLGDSDSDMEFAENAGIPAVRVTADNNLLKIATQLSQLL